MLLLNSLLPLLLLGTVSYSFIQSIFENKIDGGIRDALRQTKIGLENTFNSMEYASLQLSTDGSIGEALQRFLNSSSVAEQVRISDEIIRTINVVNFSNPNLGLLVYYFPHTHEARFSSMMVSPNFNLLNLPLLSSVKGESFYGPHQTAYRYGTNTVFSLARPIEIEGYGRDDVYVYIETNAKLFEKLLNPNVYGMKADHLLLNSEGKVYYSGNPQQFPVGSGQTLASGTSGKISESGYYVFEDRSDQGWSLAVAITKQDFYSGLYEWLLTYGAIGFLCLFASMLLALLVWRSVYRPITKIQREIHFMATDESRRKPNWTGIHEFDRVLVEFDQTTNRIYRLFGEIEQKEREKAQLGLEKLMHQINPHFIHNTLNTIQWIARMNGEREIDRLVSIFTRILHYNLAKEGGIVPLRDEVEALKDYVALQQIRYDHPFVVHFQIDKSLLDMVRIPRFILQPLIENALYHGLGDRDGSIELRIDKQAEELVIQVADNGAGMTKEEATQLFAAERDESRKAGLGIGLNYVYRVIKAHYGEASDIDIDSEIGQGTTITLRVPVNPA